MPKAPELPIPEPAAFSPAPPKPAAAPAPELPRPGFFELRADASPLQKVLAAALFLVLVLAVWTLITRGDTPESRLVSPVTLPSPAEALAAFPALWFERALTRNLAASLWRVFQGFGLAAVIGIPLGIVCGAWPRVNAFFVPLSAFGRNVPVSALVPLTVLWFGIEEFQKVMFIFVACVMFVVFDAARAVTGVHERYVQTALTLGASKGQVLGKVLVPLALPDIFGSLRLLFGLAFGYIILAEMVNMESGAGALILTSQRRGPNAHVYLILFSITLLAFGIDRLLHWVQKALFPYREA